MTVNYSFTSARYRLIRNLLLILSIAGLTSGCISSSSINNWPQNIPDRSMFVEAYNQQSLAGTNSNALEPHLVWIKRFYLGSVLYPLGWNRMTEILIESFGEDVDTLKLKERMDTLGLKISIEWAQDNRFRNIDSAAIAVWGNALRTAAEQNEQLAFIDKIEADVEALLNKQLAVNNIIRERYYPVEDFDDF